jgi:hypothetical protein
VRITAIRSRPGGRIASSRKDAGAGGAKYGAPGSAPWVASSAAALSRTDRLIT